MLLATGQGLGMVACTVEVCELVRQEMCTSCKVKCAWTPMLAM